MLKKKSGILVLAILQILISNGQQAKSLTIINTLKKERKDELVVLSRKMLTTKLGRLGAKQFVQVSKNARPLVVQYDDLDKDGIWDEAVFLYSFKPKEKALFSIQLRSAPAAIKAVVRAHVRQRHKLSDESFAPSVLMDTMPYNNEPTDFSKQKLPPYLTEGPAWENDKVGFRKYFDVRNANDIWGKVTTRMVLDEVGVDPSKIYHHFDSSWGMDILKVGKSLGAGGLALQININGKDTLVRFGSNVGQTTYEQVADGPVRAIFRIRYNNWKIAGLVQPLNAIEEISIGGGQYFYENKITISSAPAGAKLVTGLNNFYVKTADSIVNNSVNVLYTWGRQSENGDNLGMAVMVPNTSFSGFSQTPDIGSEVLNTFTISQKITSQQSISYRYYAAWERTNSLFKTKAGFKEFLLAETLKTYRVLKYP